MRQAALCTQTTLHTRQQRAAAQTSISGIRFSGWMRGFTGCVRGKGKKGSRSQSREVFLVLRPCSCLIACTANVSSAGHQPGLAQPHIPNPFPALCSAAIYLGKRRKRRARGSPSLSPHQIKDGKRVRKMWPSFWELPAGSDKGFCLTAMKQRERHCSPPEHRDSNSQLQNGNKSAALNKLRLSSENRRNISPRSSVSS